MERPIIVITAEMIRAAEGLVPASRVHRTKVSPVDTLGGILGEFAFAQWLTGDWRGNEVATNKGQADLFGLIEIKTSIYPFKDTLNLVIREDYGKKYKDVYVQNIINVEDAYRKDITAGTAVIICGFTTHEHATRGLAEPMAMRGGATTPYGVYRTPLSQLQPMHDFRAFLNDLARRKDVALPF